MSSKKTLTSDEESEARECFAMFDSDNDGFVSKGDVSMLMMSLGRNSTQKEITSLLSTIKLKRKDKVSMSEFIYLLKKGIGGVGEQGSEMLEGLKIFDDILSAKPGTGTITERELKHIMSRFGERLNKEELVGLLKFSQAASTNGNVDYAKFVDKLVNPHKYSE